MPTIQYLARSARLSVELSYNVLFKLNDLHIYISNTMKQELIRRWDSERELLRTAPRKLPDFAEIAQNNCHYAVQGHSRSFKVTDFGTNRKLICDFLLVINTKLLPILLRFRDIAFDRSKIAIFGYPSCLIPLMERFPTSYHRKW